MGEEGVGWGAVGELGALVVGWVEEEGAWVAVAEQEAGAGRQGWPGCSSRRQANGLLTVLQVGMATNESPHLRPNWLAMMAA